ncbi:hypothetical protein H5410_021903, partial [Solanum commersonii]
MQIWRRDSWDVIGICAKIYNRLVGIADSLGDPPFVLVHPLSALSFSNFKFYNIGRWSTASRNYSATCRLLLSIADLIFSFKAWHTGTLGKTIAFHATQDSIMNAHKKSQLTCARINCALKHSSCNSALPKNFKLTILASNASSSLTKVIKCPHTKNDSIFTHN